MLTNAQPETIYELNTNFFYQFVLSWNHLLKAEYCSKLIFLNKDIELIHKGKLTENLANSRG